MLPLLLVVRLLLMMTNLVLGWVSNQPGRTTKSTRRQNEWTNESICEASENKVNGRRRHTHGRSLAYNAAARR